MKDIKVINEIIVNGVPITKTETGYVIKKTAVTV